MFRGIGKKTPINTIPCALQEALQRLTGPVKHDRISKEDREIAFLKTLIVAVQITVSDFQEGEKLRCSPSGCEQDLHYLASCLHHAFFCTHFLSSCLCHPFCCKDNSSSADTARSRPLWKARTKAAIVKVARFVLPCRKLLRCSRRHQKKPFNRAELSSEAGRPVSLSEIAELRDAIPDSVMAGIDDEHYRPELPSPGPLCPELSSPGTLCSELSSPAGFCPELSGPNPPCWELPCFKPNCQRQSILCNDTGSPTLQSSDVEQGIVGVPNNPTRRCPGTPRLSIVTKHSSSMSSKGSGKAELSSTDYEECRGVAPCHVPLFRGADSARAIDSTHVPPQESESSLLQFSLHESSGREQSLHYTEPGAELSPLDAWDNSEALPFDPSAFNSPTWYEHDVSIHTTFEISAKIYENQSITLSEPLPSDQPQGGKHHSGSVLTEARGSISGVSDCNLESSEVHRGYHLHLTQNFMQDAMDRAKDLYQRFTSMLAPDKNITLLLGSSGPDLFMRGLQTLREFHGGVMPRAADSIYALVHLALQFASNTYGQVFSRPWASLPADLHLWSHAIGDQRERQVFLDATTKIWTEWSSTCRSWPNATPYIMNMEGQALEDSQRDITLDPSNDIFLYRALSGGAVIQLCSRFSEDFERLDIIEKRNIGADCSPDCERDDVRCILVNIIQPLSQSWSSSPLHENVVKVEDELNGGLLQTVRQVEVMLLEYPMVCTGLIHRTVLANRDSGVTWLKLIS